MDKEIFQRQIDLEQKGIEQGIAKFKKEYLEATQGGAMSDTPVGGMLIYTLMDTYYKGLKEYCMPCGRQSVRDKATIAFIKSVGCDKVAFITLKILISEIAKGGDGTKLTGLLKNISKAIETERQIIDFSRSNINNNDVSWAGYVTNVIKGKSRQGSNKMRTIKALKSMMQDKGFVLTHLDSASLIEIGAKLLNIFQEKTGLLKFQSKRRSINREDKVVEPTPAFMKLLDEIKDRCEILNPVLYPMLIKPLPYTPTTKGGFITPALQRPLVKDAKGLIKKYIYDKPMPQVYNAINQIQNTAWVINKRVLEVLAEYINRETAFPELDIPSGAELELPPKAWADDLTSSEWEEFKRENSEIVRLWQDEARAVYNKRASDKSKRILYKSLVSMATTLKDEAELYFCYDLDWRGRVYPVQCGGCPNPQGIDASKALIMFAKGVALGEKGAEWLSMAGANAFGDDKIPMIDRANWAKLHEDNILAVAKDPFTNKWWWEADASWKFLAFCFEWADYVKSGYSKDFISYLPVALDGSCSGIQHFSALLLDERGARATNVIPNEIDKPSDIYAEVALVVEKQVKQDALNKKPEAILLNMLGVNRTLTKRNTMTTPYGVTMRGMLDQLLDELPEDVYKSDNVRFFDVCKYLASANYSAIGQVVVASRMAMDWLKEVAGVMAEADKVFYWTTPSGFKVQQKYEKPNIKRVSTFWGGTKIRLNIEETSNQKGLQLNHTKTIQGQAPNYIHSLDASHLILTVNACIGHNITEFALIHDSFGTHAGNTEKLAQILREEFVRMYQVDNLKIFREEIINQLPKNLQDKVPQCPNKGNLDITKVIHSKYFFA